MFSDTTQGLEESFNISGSRLISLNESGNYTVTAYDLTDDTIFGPAVELPNSVIIIIPSESSPTNSKSLYTCS